MEKEDRDAWVISIAIMMFLVTPLILSMISTEMYLSRREPDKCSFKTEGLITDKKTIHDGTCNDYFFIINGTVKCRVAGCVYHEFGIGDYFYRSERGAISKDGITYEALLCDDWSNTTCVRDPLWGIVILGAIILTIIFLCLYIFIRIGIPLLKIKIKKARK